MSSKAQLNDYLKRIKKELAELGKANAALKQYTETLELRVK